MKTCKTCQVSKEENKFGMNGKWRRNVCYDCRAKKTIKVKIVKENNPKYDFDMKDIKMPELLPKPIRCEYTLCNCIIPLPNREERTIRANTSISQIKGNIKYYCNEWCKEMAEIDRITIRKCKYCENSVEPTINIRNGMRVGWKALCEECAGRRDNSLSLKTLEQYGKKETQNKQ